MLSTIGTCASPSRPAFAASARRSRASGASGRNDAATGVRAVHPRRRRSGGIPPRPGVPSAPAAGQQVSRDLAEAVERTLAAHLGHRHNLEIFIVARDRTVVMASGSCACGESLSLRSVAEAMTGRSGWRIDTWPGGDRYLTGYAPVDGIRSDDGPAWVVLARRPVAQGPTIPETVGQTGSALASIATIVGWVAVTTALVPPAAAGAGDVPRVASAIDIRDRDQAVVAPGVFAALGTLIESLDHKDRTLDALADRAYRDVLTGLANRAALERFFDGGADPSAAWSVLAVDLDGFKGVNDRLGHAAGDTLLRLAAECIARCTRSCDFAARAGGDEFVVFLRHDDKLDAVSARKAAERLVAAISRPYVVEGETATVGASIGMATTPGDGPDLRSVLRLADRALYAAKRTGRGRLVVHDRRALTPSEA